MAVVHQHKDKVWLVLDYCELNQHIDAFTTDADICAAKLREWHQQDSNMSLLNLQKVYLQIRIDELLWPFQAIIFHCRRYCLTSLGFGLNVAPIIMKTIEKQHHAKRCMLAAPRQ